MIYSGRAAQEVRLRREIGNIIDLMMADEIDERFVPTEKMKKPMILQKVTGTLERELEISVCQIVWRNTRMRKETTQET